MIKVLTAWTLVLICAVMLLPLSSAYVANSSTYSIDSTHTGLAGVNASSSSYELRSVTTYQLSGSPNANTASYKLNLGVLGEYVDMCGNGRRDYKEYCDNGAGNGACPSTCSSYCTLNTCAPVEDDDDDDGGSSSSGRTVWYPPSARLNSTPAPVISYESRTFLILPNGTTVMNFNSSNIPLSSITLTTTQAVPNVRFVIRPTLNSTLAYDKDTVYNYLQIDHEALPDYVISGVKIRFTVTRAWMNNNSIQKTDIRLFRYVYGWEALPTRIVGEATNFVYYEAESPGLSIFAISKKGETFKPTGIPAISGNAVDDGLNNTPSDNGAPTLGNDVAGSAANSGAANAAGAGTAASNNTRSMAGASGGLMSNKLVVIIPVAVVLLILIAVVVIKKRKSEEAENKISTPMVKHVDPLVLRLEDWVSKQEVKGYTDKQLEDHLISKGYPKEKIDEAILELKK